LGLRKQHIGLPVCFSTKGRKEKRNKVLKKTQSIRICNSLNEKMKLLVVGFAKPERERKAA
jgi:hypothetical protein